jgi:hypothetical protein
MWVFGVCNSSMWIIMFHHSTPHFDMFHRSTPNVIPLRENTLRIACPSRQITRQQRE